MSQENVEIVQRAMAAYMGNDAVTVRQLVTPDVVISMRPDQPDPQEHHGYDGMLKASEEWLEAWDEQTFETARTWGADDYVFVCTREVLRGKLSGIPMEHSSTFVYTLDNGRIVRIQIFGSEREALKAAGLEEHAVSQENVETVRRAIAAINARDIDAYLAFCTENVELLLPMVGSEYLGAEGIRRFFTDIEDIGPDLRIEVERVQAIGDSNALALVRTRSTGRASGIVTGAESANVYDFTDSKISRIRIFLDRGEALKAVGLI